MNIVLAREIKAKHILFQKQISEEGDAKMVGMSVINTIMGSSGGGLMSLFLTHLQGKKWRFMAMLNGALAGCVAECAGCNVYEPWAGFVVRIYVV